MSSSFRTQTSKSKIHLRAWLNSLFIDHAFFRLCWSNRGVVAEGEMYRSNHPTPGRLKRDAKRYGLKTVLNLRGERDCGSDGLSYNAAREIGLIFVDLPFESRGAPHKERILRLFEFFRTAELPVLIHCKSGADRTGLVAGLYILFKGGTGAEALEQLSGKYLHIKSSATGILDKFFELYIEEGEGKKPFLQWLTEDYDEERLRAAFKVRPFGSFWVEKVLRRE